MGTLATVAPSVGPPRASLALVGCALFATLFVGEPVVAAPPARAPSQATGASKPVTPLEAPPSVAVLVMAPNDDETLSLLVPAAEILVREDIARAARPGVSVLGGEDAGRAALMAALPGFLVDDGAPAPGADRATHVVVVTTSRTPSGVHLEARLIDATRALVVGHQRVDTFEDTLVDEARALVTRLAALDPLSGLVDVAALPRLRHVDAASARALGEARRALEIDDVALAERRFTFAMRESPELARRFDDLVARFVEVRARVVVLPFSSERGERPAPWQPAGLRAAVAHDLAALGLDVVDAAASDALALSRGALVAAGVVADEHARALAQESGADLAAVGSVLVEDALVRLSLRLVHARSGRIVTTVVVDDLAGGLTGLVRACASALASALGRAPSSPDALLAAQHTNASLETWARTASQPPMPDVALLATSTVRRVREPGRPLSLTTALGVIAIVGGLPVAAGGALAAQPFAARAWQLHGLQDAVVDPRMRETLRADRDRNATLANLSLAVSAVGFAAIAGGVTAVVVDRWLESRSRVVVVDADASSEEAP